MSDSLTSEVLRNALVVAAEEASIVVVKAAYSTFIVEGSDASAAILDKDGRLVAHSMATTLMNSMALSVAVPFLLEDHPREQMRPGDVFMTNDAYRGGIHTNDLLVFRPIFVGDQVEYFAATLIHVSDLGGISAGGMATLATEIFLEGLQLPAVRIASSEGFDDQLMRVLAINSRTPDKVLGDVRALVAGTRVAAARIESLIDEYGVDAFQQGVTEYLDHTELLTRKALSELANGTFAASYVIDDDGLHPGVSYAVRVAVTVEDGRLVLDFAGTDDQVAAAINSSLSQSLAAAVFAVRCFLDPTIPMNDGCLRVLDVRLPEGSLLNAQSPYPCGGRFIPCYAAIDAVWSALSDAIPARGVAPSGILQPFTIAAHDAPYWIHLAYDFGGCGARASSDGPDATGVHFGLGRNSVPQVEPVEGRCPFVVERVELITDSGGAGTQRGGLGTRTVFRLHADADVTTRGDRLVNPPAGRDGGGAGRAGGFFRIRQDGDVERLPSKVNNERFRSGEAFMVETTGGAGMGDPRKRAPEQVCQDVRDNKVSRRAAKDVYGVVLTDALAVDVDATSRERDRMVAAHG